MGDWVVGAGLAFTALTFKTYLAITAGAPITADIGRQRMLGFEPASLQVLVRTPPHADNRGICVGVVDEEGFVEQQSCWTVEGDQAPVTTQRWFHHLSAGTYRVRAAVCRGRWDGTACAGRWITDLSPDVQVFSRGN